MYIFLIAAFCLLSLFHEYKKGSFQIVSFLVCLFIWLFVADNNLSHDSVAINISVDKQLQIFPGPKNLSKIFQSPETSLFERKLQYNETGYILQRSSCHLLCC